MVQIATPMQRVGECSPRQCTPGYEAVEQRSAIFFWARRTRCVSRNDDEVLIDRVFTLEERTKIHIPRPDADRARCRGSRSESVLYRIKESRELPRIRAEESRAGEGRPSQVADLIGGQTNHHQADRYWGQLVTDEANNLRC
jgi:hypothetical protein